MDFIVKIRSTLILCLTALTLVSSRTSALFAIEPWADETLPVKDSLALWLDASVETRARCEEGKTIEKQNTPLGVWCDLSGNKRHAKQFSEVAQPKFGTSDQVNGFSFDGEGQHFVVTSKGLKLHDATVVIFARAKSNPGEFRCMLSASQAGVNDYVSGFNVDLGSNPSEGRLSVLNVEGSGFGGMRDLLGETCHTGCSRWFHRTLRTGTSAFFDQ